MSQSTPANPKPCNKNHDWYDKWNLGLLAATFLALVIYTAVTAWLAWLTSDVAKEATRAANIADKQLAVAKDTETRQLRAYLHVSHAPFPTPGQHTNLSP